MSQRRRAQPSSRRRPGAAGTAGPTSYITNLGIDPSLAVTTLIIAVVSAALAAVLDMLLGLPTSALRFTFGWVIAALAGATYSFYTRGYRAPALIMAVVNGMVAFLVYYVVWELIGDEFGWAYQLNVLKALVSGLVAGLVGFGWFAALKRIPPRLI